MNRVATPGYLRFPHVHDDLLAFVAEDDVWLAPADGGRAWRLTADGGQASHPRFSPDGATIAWTSWRDGGIPEVYTADIDGGTAGPRPGAPTGATRVPASPAGPNDEMLAITAADQPSAQRTMAYAVPLDAPARRLPFGQVNDLALTPTATVLLTAQRGDPSHWKRYRGGTARPALGRERGRPAVHAGTQQSQRPARRPMIVDDRIVFLSDHEGRATSTRPPSTAATCAGTPTTTASTPATPRPTATASSTRWPATSGGSTAWPPTRGRASWTSSSAAPPAARVP